MNNQHQIITKLSKQVNKTVDFNPNELQVTSAISEFMTKHGLRFVTVGRYNSLLAKFSQKNLSTKNQEYT